jgi:D-alanyl-D-alanine carboxypeptidase
MDRRRFLVGTAAGAAAVSLATGARVEDAGPPSPLAEFLADQLKDTGFGGTVLAARGDAVERHAFGPAERAFGTPCAADTVYRIASITKLMTATVVTRLAEAGRLDLDAPIAAHLPAYRGEGATRVKVRHLLNHTSGIENYDKDLTGFADAMRNGMPAYQLALTPAELMDRFASGPLVREPGAGFDYNNADYVILGQIIEAVEGVGYEQALRAHVLEPLRMTATAMAPQGVTPRLASTYYRDGDDGPLWNDLPVYGRNWYAAGGLVSTADDLLAFARGLYGGRLVSAAGLEAMLAPGLDEYGFGQWVSTLKVGETEHRFAQRPGRIMGANTLLLRMLDDDVTVVILANTNLVDTDRLGFRIARHVLGQG